MRVRVSSVLHAYTDDRAEVEAEGATVREVLGDLDDRYPGFAFRIIDEQDRIRPHMRIWLTDRWVKKIDERVAPGDSMDIIAALSGG